MSDQHDEKFDEKEAEKREEKKEEKSPEEKSWDEKHQRDPLSTVVWGAILIWAGLVLLASTTGFLDNFTNRLADTPGFRFLGQISSAWGLICIGAAVIILLEIVVRLLMPAYRRPVLGSFILAMIFLGIGLGNLWNWNVAWALILIVLGVSFVTRSLRRR